MPPNLTSPRSTTRKPSTSSRSTVPTSRCRRSRAARRLRLRTMAELAAFAVFALNPPVIFDILLRFSLGACALEGSKDGKPFKGDATMKTSMHKLVTLCIAAAICAVATSAMAAVNSLESYLFRVDFSKGANEFSSSPSYADSTSSARIRRRQTGRTGCRAPRQRQARRGRRSRRQLHRHWLSREGRDNALCGGLPVP